MNFAFLKNSRGFTMIEMMVIIAIVAILPTIIIANFPQIKLQFALSRSAHRFSQDLRRAQEMSLSFLRYRDAAGNFQTVTGYGVHIDLPTLGNKKYIIYADAYPGNHVYDDLDYTVSVMDLAVEEPGVVIKEMNNVFGASASINFNPPDPTTTITDLNDGENNIEVVFALESNTNTTKTVSVNISGLIEIE